MSKSILRGKINSKVFILLLVFGLVCTISVAANFGRVAQKGSNYELAEYQDGIYYFAMSKNLFSKPTSLSDELSEFPELNSASSAAEKYFRDNSDQWHLENGLSHSPPYAYRILQPVIVMLLGEVGIKPKLGFLLVSSFGLGLMGVFLHLLLIRSRISAWLSILMIMCFSATTLNLIPNPTLTDCLFLGLSVVCIYLQKNGRLNLAFLVSSIAVLNRETSLIIWLYLVIFVILKNKKNFRFTKSQIIFISIAPLTFAIPRLTIIIPNKDYPITDIVDGLLKPEIMALSLGLLFALITCSPLPFLILTRQLNKVTMEDYLLFTLGIACFLISCSLGANTERFLLTCWPMFMFYDSLSSLANRNALILFNTFGLLILGSNDFLNFNSSINLKYLAIVEMLLLFGINFSLFIVCKKKSLRSTVLTSETHVKNEEQ